MSILLESGLTCLAMAVNDSVATILTVAEAKGNANLAGNLDMLGDIARFALYSFAGERLLTHGLVGWVALLPVMATSNVTTRLATRYATRMRPAGQVP